MSVVARDLSKHFGGNGEVAAVSNVSFEAPSDRITALLGPSGSGKSTLLRLVAGLERPDSGVVSIDGKDVTRVPVRERQVGFVFQSYALFRHMTVFENVAFGMRVRKRPDVEVKERVKELLALVQLDGYAARRPDELSGGQRQRIALARALAVKPRVLLLDEPFGALDAKVRVELREWLRTLHEETKTTTLLVTHDQEEALEIADSVVLLESGKVSQAGSPTELYERPANAFVASFLGGANVLPAKIQGGRAELGSIGVEAPREAEGSEVQAIVRPHDVRLVRAEQGATGANVARVERVVKVGAWVKVSVVLSSGDPLAVQMPRLEFDERPVEPGDRVLVEMAEVKLFRRDYAI
jgi:sulfate transport system ATP-binding protein